MKKCCCVIVEVTALFICLIYPPPPTTLTTYPQRKGRERKRERERERERERVCVCMSSKLRDIYPFAFFLPPKERERVAVHEAGHAVASWHLPRLSKVAKVWGVLRASLRSEKDPSNLSRIYREIQ